MNKIDLNKIRTVCVYCGSGPGTNPHFMESAKALGKTFAENGIRLVYGGGSLGLMGAIATSVLDHGGMVTGIIPDFLTARENALSRVQEMVVTPDMHERKRLMFERADAFVALPGGVGTLEELVEQLTWAQLGRHKKPILALNVARFWDPLCTLLEQMEKLDFIRANLPIMLLAGSAGVWLFYVQHQFEQTSWSKIGEWNSHVSALHGSSYYDLPGFLRWLTANIGIHHVHHLSSRIPYYRLPRVLRDHPELRGVGRLTLLQSFRCVRLVLWDETQRRLVSFREASARG